MRPLGHFLHVGGKVPAEGGVEGGDQVHGGRAHLHHVEGDPDPGLILHLFQHRQLGVALGEVGQHDKVRPHCPPLLDSLGEGGVLLDLGVVDHVVLHGCLVDEEVGRAAPLQDVPELLARPGVPAVPDLQC